MSTQAAKAHYQMDPVTKAWFAIQVREVQKVMDNGSDEALRELLRGVFWAGYEKGRDGAALDAKVRGNG